VYAKDSGTTLKPNFIWLRTYDDAASLTSVRRALPDLDDRDDRLPRLPGGWWVYEKVVGVKPPGEIAAPKTRRRCD
jgi:hypothetical protein